MVVAPINLPPVRTLDEKGEPIEPSVPASAYHEFPSGLADGTTVVVPSTAEELACTKELNVSIKERQAFVDKYEALIKTFQFDDYAVNRLFTMDVSDKWRLYRKTYDEKRIALGVSAAASAKWDKLSDLEKDREYVKGMLDWLTRIEADAAEAIARIQLNEFEVKPLPSDSSVVADDAKTVEPPVGIDKRPLDPKEVDALIASFGSLGITSDPALATTTAAATAPKTTSTVCCVSCSSVRELKRDAVITKSQVCNRCRSYFCLECVTEKKDGVFLFSTKCGKVYRSSRASFMDGCSCKDPPLNAYCAQCLVHHALQPYAKYSPHGYLPCDSLYLAPEVTKSRAEEYAKAAIRLCKEIKVSQHAPRPKTPDFGAVVAERRSTAKPRAVQEPRVLTRSEAYRYLLGLSWL